MKLGDPLKGNVTSHGNGGVTRSLAHKNLRMVAMPGRHRISAAAPPGHPIGSVRSGMALLRIATPLHLVIWLFRLLNHTKLRLKPRPKSQSRQRSVAWRRTALG